MKARAHRMTLVVDGNEQTFSVPVVPMPYEVLQCGSEGMSHFVKAFEEEPITYRGGLPEKYKVLYRVVMACKNPDAPNYKGRMLILNYSLSPPTCKVCLSIMRAWQRDQAKKAEQCRS